MTDATPPLHGVAFTDVAHSLGQTLGGLLPWLEPAVETLTKSEVDRDRVLGGVAPVLIDTFESSPSGFAMSEYDAAAAADAFLARYVVAKAMELRAREEGVQMRSERSFR